MASTDTAKTDHAQEEHHDHVVSWQILTAVLAALLVLTGITVGAAFIDMGESLNVFVALAIATVKATLVAAIFMHLRWDKPINSIVLLFSVLLLVLFLFMSILDTGQYQDSIIPEFSKDKMAALRAAQPGAASEGEGEASGASALPEDAEKLLKKSQKMFRSKNAEGKKVHELPTEWASPDNEITDAKVALGQMLYFDARLSLADDVSCASCHDLTQGGDDPRETPTSAGHEGQTGDRNSPTTLNAALHTSQFWDGRAPTVEAQAIMPITNPIEMAMPDNDAVVAKLKGIAGYAEPFKAAFGGDDPITIENVGNAIGAFERRLLTRTKFDDFLSGDLNALSAEQYDGLRAYIDVGCNSCHAGLGLGGTMKQVFGSMGGYGGHPDEGQMFKATGLRNITLTAPYYHDGSEPSLEKALVDMAKYQLGKDLTAEQTKALMAFMEALEGQPPAELTKKPELPQ
jgi:cytochrome c peroxidase